MTELLPSTYTLFLTRFSNLYDALVVQVSYSFRTAHRNSQVVITLTVQDQERPADHGWCTLTFTIDDIVEFRLIEGNSTNSVLSSGLTIGNFANSVYLDFSPYTDEPRGLADFQRSSFLVAGRRCSWFVSD